MKKILITLAALMFGVQAYATTLTIKNKTSENLHFWTPNHPRVNNFTNRRIIKPGRSTTITLTAQGLRGPFYFARTRDLEIKKIADGRKFRRIYKIPDDGYPNDMELVTWFYKWNIANIENSQPGLGMRVRRTYPVGGEMWRWVNLEKTVDYL